MIQYSSNKRTRG